MSASWANSLNPAIIDVFYAFHNNRSMVDSIDLDSEKGSRHAPGHAAGKVVDIELNVHFGGDTGSEGFILILFYKNEKQLILREMQENQTNMNRGNRGDKLANAGRREVVNAWNVWRINCGG